jgi:hypothetical protein
LEVGANNLKRKLVVKESGIQVNRMRKNTLSLSVLVGPKKGLSTQPLDSFYSSNGSPQKPIQMNHGIYFLLRQAVGFYSMKEVLSFSSGCEHFYFHKHFIDFSLFPIVSTKYFDDELKDLSTIDKFTPFDLR